MTCGGVVVTGTGGVVTGDADAIGAIGAIGVAGVAATVSVDSFVNPSAMP